VIAAHSAQLIKADGSIVDGSSSQELAGACFAREWNSFSGMNESLLAGVALQPWITADTAAWAFSELLPSGSMQPLLANASISVPNRTEAFERTRFFDRRWAAVVSAPNLAAAQASTRCPPSSDEPCNTIGPVESPVTATLPPLPTGLASIRVSYRTTGGLLRSSDSGWVTTECRGCLWVGSPQNSFARLAGTFGQGAEDDSGSRGKDGMALSRVEFGYSSGSLGFGSAVRFHDVDGDGQLDAIVTEGRE